MTRKTRYFPEWLGRAGAPGVTIAVTIAVAGCSSRGESVDNWAATDAGVKPDAHVERRYTDYTPFGSDGGARGPDRAGDGGGRGTPEGGTNATSACVPAAEPDVSDDDFADTNCDGIDGDASAAIFVAPVVAPDGGTAGDGTREAPAGSIGAGLRLAKERGKNAVYVCTGVYEENLVVTEGIEVYGGFDCERGWERVNDVGVVRASQGVPLVVHGVKARVALHSLAFHAAAATAPGGSSIAAVVSSSDSVLLRRVELVAADGKAGLDGTDVSIAWEPVPAAAPGEDADSVGTCRIASTCGSLLPTSDNPSCRIVSAGGDGAPYSCPSGSVVRGGRGGRGGNCGRAVANLPGEPGSPEPGARGDGADGEPGVSGVAGKSFGRIVSGTYVPSGGRDGQFGEDGAPGRGGDGALSSRTNTAPAIYFTVGGGGGQGGYPGCGGPGGKGGGGGGASIALVVDHAKVSLVEGRIVTGRGGDGGAPSFGVAGQAGGEGGRAATGAWLVAAQKGGSGGKGGRGGAGGPGAGGPSVGIASVGGAPEIQDVLFELGEPGIGATGAAAAPDGLKAEVHDNDQTYTGAR